MLDLCADMTCRSFGMIKKHTAGRPVIKARRCGLRLIANVEGRQ